MHQVPRPHGRPALPPPLFPPSGFLGPSALREPLSQKNVGKNDLLAPGGRQQWNGSLRSP